MSTAATAACVWPRCLGAGPREAECVGECAHTCDSPALCELFAFPEPFAAFAEVGSTSAGGRVEAASDGAAWA